MFPAGTGLCSSATTSLVLKGCRGSARARYLRQEHKPTRTLQKGPWSRARIAMGGSHHAHYPEVTTSEMGTPQRALENALMQTLEACGAVGRAQTWKARPHSGWCVCVRAPAPARRCVLARKLLLSLSFFISNVEANNTFHGWCQDIIKITNERAPS